MFISLLSNNNIQELQDIIKATINEKLYTDWISNDMSKKWISNKEILTYLYDNKTN